MTATVPRPVATLVDQLVHLRPIVHASPTVDGIHVRGWTSSFSVAGGPGLWRIWERVACALVDGSTEAELAALSAHPAVRVAVQTVLDQLRAHDMLVELPRGWRDGELEGGPSPQLGQWLQSVADDPAQAWRRLTRVEVAVHGTGLVAAAARRALATSGIRHRRAGGSGALVTCGPHAVAAACDDSVGFVSAPSCAGDGVALADRLGLRGDVDPEPVLAALVGGAAAHRLICAIAGLPDPGTPVPPGFDAVLVARLDPVQATYHPWRTGPTRAAPTDLPGALAAVDALCDPELGSVPAPDVADLPQLPAGSAAVTSAAGTTYGVAGTPEVARLVAILGAVERGLGADVAVGADARHAAGVLLRRLAQTAPGAVMPNSTWAGAPMARLWWKTLVLRFGVDATVQVRRLADGVFRADVLIDGLVVASAIEALPGDAVAFAALAAVGVNQWVRAGRDEGAHGVAACGATPAARPEPSAAARWQVGAWSWPADVGDAEPALQVRLRNLLGVEVEVEPFVAYAVARVRA